MIECLKKSSIMRVGWKDSKESINYHHQILPVIILRCPKILM